jgi:hypothetical protein
MQSNTLQKSFQGFCPMLETSQTVQVLYTLIKTDNGPVMYKAFSYQCENMENCIIGFCPLMAEIPAMVDG